MLKATLFPNLASGRLGRCGGGGKWIKLTQPTASNRCTTWKTRSQSCAARYSTDVMPSFGIVLPSALSLLHFPISRQSRKFFSFEIQNMIYLTQYFIVGCGAVICRFFQNASFLFWDCDIDERNCSLVHWQQWVNQTRSSGMFSMEYFEFY